MPVAANKTASDNQSLPNMPPFAVQKAIFYTTKGHLSHGERWPFEKRLIASKLLTRHFISLTLWMLTRLLQLNPSST